MISNEIKERKKVHKKALRKKVFWWKTGSILTGIFAGIMIPTTILLSVFDNTVAAFLGGTFWELENPDLTAKYFTSDFNSNEEMIEYGEEVVKQIELEGASLLKNDNNALPLSSGQKVSLFSNSSVNLVFGGTGSGNVDASSADTLKKSFEDAGLVVNDKLWNFYLSKECKKYARVNQIISFEPAKVTEVPWSVYPDSVKQSFEEYGDAAFVVLSRVGGEGADLAYSLDGKVNYLALDNNEKEMMRQIKLLKDEGKIKKVVVLINSSNALQVDFLKDNEYGVDACMWIGDLGSTGVNAIGELVAGKVNPSGSLVDTYCYDNFSSPAMANSVPTTYLGYDGKNIPKDASTYMIYQEGIYVGYKYYETRYEDYVLNKGNAGNYQYSNDVAFPFGHGLSYTTFEYSNFNASYVAADDRFYVSIDVKNIGEVAGKETVQIYGQQPYTQYDIDNGIEKASVQLIGFDKTNTLAPGQTETLNIEIDRREFASYDTYGAKTYILDAGDYHITAATDAHNAVNNILASKGKTPENTNGKMDAKGNSNLVYTYNNKELDTITYSKSLNGTTITNQLQSADINLYEGIKEGTKVTYLTRNNWTDTMPKIGNVLRLELTPRMIKDLQNLLYDPNDYDPVEMPKLGQPGNLKLYDMMGKDYNDPMWEELLNQVTFDEMVSLIGDAFHWTMPLKSIEAPGSRNENGPQGLTALLLASNDSSTLKATALTSEDVLAATFNVDLVAEAGRIIGNNCLVSNINVLYGPGNNTHRTPYGGRNFEYYSEDSFLSGVISAHEIKAIQEKGVHVVMKHFALNDSEQDRIGLGVWVNEQAAREIYLKAFQIPFEKGNANGVMTAYTRWGCIWSGAHKGLMTNIMRGEWGSNGLTITDNILTNYTNGVDALLAGVSIFDAMLPNIINQLPKYENDPIVVTAMREATHHNLYALVNSCGMNLVGPNTTIKVISELPVVTICKVVSIILSVAFAGLLGMYIYSRIKFNKSEEHQEYLRYKKEYKNKK